MTNEARLIIIGAGALALELRQWELSDGEVKEPLFVVDDEHGKIEDHFEFLPGDKVIIAIANSQARASMFDRLEKVISQLCTYQHSTSLFMGIVNDDGQSTQGSMMFPYSIVSANAHLGRGTILNCHSTVGHDVVLGDFCTLSSHVDICGNVKVGDRVFFGSGARVLPGLTIGSDAVIGAGAVVVNDVPTSATVFGVPARKVS